MLRLASACLFALLVIVNSGLVWAVGNEPVNQVTAPAVTTPDAQTKGFRADAKTFFQEETPAIFGRWFPGDWVYSGGLHGTSITCVTPAFSVEAFTLPTPTLSAADRVRAKSDGTGGAATIDYGALGVPGCTSGTSIARVAVCSISGNTTGNFHRATGSNYFVNSFLPSQAIPAGCAGLMDVEITNGAIVAVTDIRHTSPNIPGAGGGGGPLVTLSCHGTDDTAHVQGVLTALQSTGGVILHPGITPSNPSGICRISGASRLTYNSIHPIELRGVGIQSQFVWDNPVDSGCHVFGAECEFNYFPEAPLHDTSFINLHGTADGVIEQALQGVIVTGLKFDCNGKGPSFPYTVNYDSRHHCLGIYYAINVYVVNNDVVNTDAEGIYINQFDSFPFTTAIYHNTYVAFNRTFNTHIDGINDASTDATVFANSIDTSFNGIEVGRARSKVISNYVTNTLGPAIASQINGTTITGNIGHNTPIKDVFGFGVGALQLSGGVTLDTHTVTITGNTFYYDDPCVSFDCGSGTSIGITLSVAVPDETKLLSDVIIANNNFWGYQICFRGIAGTDITIEGNKCTAVGATTPQRLAQLLANGTDAPLSKIVLDRNHFTGDTTDPAVIISEVNTKPNSFELSIGQNWLNGVLVDGNGQTHAVADDTATPLLRTYGQGHTFSLTSTAPITRTNFPGWNDGDEIVLLFADEKQTIANNSNIQTIDGRPWTAPLGSLSTFKRVTNRWIEAGRTLPAGVPLCVIIAETTATLDLSVGSPGHCYYIQNSAPTTITHITFPTCCDVPFTLYFLDSNTTLAHDAGGLFSIELLGQTDFHAGLAHSMTFLPAQSFAWQTGGYCNVATGSGCPHLRMSYTTLNAITIAPGNSGYCRDCTVGATCTGSGGGAMFIVIESGAKRCF